MNGKVFRGTGWNFKFCHFTGTGKTYTSGLLLARALVSLTCTIRPVK